MKRKKPVITKKIIYLPVANFCDYIVQHLGIVDVISNYTYLREDASGWKGLCPLTYHPSQSVMPFKVNKDKQLFHCRSCKKKGTIVDFIALMKELTPMEAAWYLVDRYGITPPAGQEFPERVEVGVAECY